MKSVAIIGLSLSLIFFAFLSMTALLPQTAQGTSEALASVGIVAEMTATEQTEVLDLLFDQDRVDESSHAITKHSTDALWVYNCLDDPSSRVFEILMQYKADGWGKKIDVCILGDIVGFRVFKKTGSDKNGIHWSERTAYIREELKSTWEFIQFFHSLLKDFNLIKIALRLVR